MRLPDGASTDRADAAAQKIEAVISKLPGVDTYFVLGGLDIATGTSNSNVATVIATLKPWEERATKDTQLDAILGAAQRGFAQVPEAFTFAFGLPPILGLSPTGGFQFMLEDRAGGDVANMACLRCPGRRRPAPSGLGTVISTFRPRCQLLHPHGYRQAPDQDLADRRLQHAANELGGLYVNDFSQFGHTWRVLRRRAPVSRSAIFYRALRAEFRRRHGPALHAGQHPSGSPT
jgi:multidrug efflux pump subunit AcrB